MALEMAAVSAVFGAAVYLLGRMVVRPRVSFAAETTRFHAARRLAAQHPDVRTSTRKRLSTRLVGWLRGRGVDLSSLEADLAMTGRSAESFAGRVVGLAAVGFCIPVGITLAPALQGEIPSAVPIGGGVLFGLLVVAASIGDLRNDAAARRAKFERSLSVYLNQVAMALAGGRGHPEALPLAATHCRGWAFEMLARAIEDARDEGIMAWEAFGRLGRQIGVDELEELSSALTLVSDDGARVKETLSARARALRAKRLAADAEQAEARTRSIRLAQMFIAAGFLIWNIYPSMANLFAY